MMFCFCFPKDTFMEIWGFTNDRQLLMNSNLNNVVLKFDTLFNTFIKKV